MAGSAHAGEWPSRDDDGPPPVRADSGGVALAYAIDDAEEPGAETVVFVEPLGLGQWTWRYIRQRLSRFRRVSFDTRGTGDSESGIAGILKRLPAAGGLRSRVIATVGGYSVGELAADLDAVIGATGAAPAHLVGADLGGMVALTYALEYDRAASVTLCGCSPGGDPASAIADRFRTIGRGDRAAVEDGLDRLFSDGYLSANGEAVERIVEWRLASDAADDEWAAQTAALAGFDATDRLGSLDVPALVVHGGADDLVPLAEGRRLHEAIPDAELAVFEDAGHLCFVERPGVIAERIGGFVDDT